MSRSLLLPGVAEDGSDAVERMCPVASLLFDLVRPVVDAAEFDHVGVAEVGEGLRGLLAAVAAAAVHQDELVLVGQRTRDVLSD